MPTYSYENKTYTLSELRFLFPAVSFPAFPSKADLAPFGVTLVPDPEPTPEERLAKAKATRLALLSERFAVAEREGHFLSSLGFEVDANETANRATSRGWSRDWRPQGRMIRCFATTGMPCAR